MSWCNIVSLNIEINSSFNLKMYLFYLKNIQRFDSKVFIRYTLFTGGKKKKIYIYIYIYSIKIIYLSELNSLALIGYEYFLQF
jgi:hypothetical protein